MPDSILARLSHSFSLQSSLLLSPIQSQVDGLIGGFIEKLGIIVRKGDGYDIGNFSKHWVIALPKKSR